MIYACEDCGFLFRRVSEVDECPFCQSSRIRSANEEEHKVLEHDLALQSTSRKELIQK